MDQAPAPVTIDVVSDVVCPWCYIGKRRLEAALKLMPDVEVQVQWRPFQLDPTIPPGGIDRIDYLTRKFGADKISKIHEHIGAAGREAGIDFQFEKIMLSPNTLDAHRLIRWASGSALQSELVESLFSAYFIEGRDIGDHEVLLDLASRIGMSVDRVRSMLKGEADVESVVDEIGTAVRLGVSGVPFFIFANQFAVPGAQSAEVLASAIERVVKGSPNEVA